MQEVVLGRPHVLEAELFAFDRQLEVLQQPLLFVARVLVPVFLRHEDLSEVSELHRHRNAPLIGTHAGRVLERERYSLGSEPAVELGRITYC